MNNKYYSYIIIFLLMMCGCSETNQDVKEDTGKEQLSIKSGISTSVITESRATRGASDPEFKEPFDLFVNQTAPAGFVSHTKFDARYAANHYEVYSGTDKWYWDDKGGKGAIINLIGIYPKGVTSSIETSFSWAVKANQTVKADSIASDLLISKQVAGYNLETQKQVALADVEFHHVFSQLTFILKKGIGFKDDGSDFTPTLKTIGLKTEADITVADNGEITIAPKGISTEMTPRILIDKQNTKTLSVIVIPGQTLTKGNAFAHIEITINGVPNSYSVILPDPLPGPDTDITFESGKNYKFEITVNKIDAEVAATIAPWGDTTSITQSVNVAVDDNGIMNSNVKEGASLFMKIERANNEVTGLRSATTYESSAWKALDPVLYWDDIPTSTTTYARAILFNTTKTEPEDIYTGKSQLLDKPYSYLKFTNMIHPFSKVNIKLRTEDGASYAVDLTELQRIKFNANIIQFKEIDESGANASYPIVTYKTSVESEIPLSISGSLGTESEGTSPVKTYKYYKIPTIYINPTLISKGGELLRIFQQDGTNTNLKNEYPLILQSDVTFKANEVYEITVTLTKTEIAELAVTIKNWQTGSTIDGNAGIDQ